MEPEPSPSLDGDHSKDGSGTESETMHTGFMQTGPKHYRCGSTLIDMTKADEETHFNFKALPKDIALEVECGENHAMMYLSKLYQGSKGRCIEFQGNWITPNEFQAVSGRESAKGLKRSIRHHGRSLKLLLSKGVLDVHPAACRCDSCRLLQQSNGKTPSVDGQSGDEKQTKSTPTKKKKKDKDKGKNKDKNVEKKKTKKEKESEDKAEVNGDVPIFSTGLVPPVDKPAEDKEVNNSSTDSSSSSDDDDTSDEETDEGKKTPPKGVLLFPETIPEQPKRVEAIKVKIPRNLPTNPASSSSDSSSSGDSSDDDSDDDDSSEEEEQGAGGSVPPLNPASLNEPLFPDLKATVTIKPQIGPKKESSSSDDEPLANINRKLASFRQEEIKAEEEAAAEEKKEEEKESVVDSIIKTLESEEEAASRVDETMKKEEPPAGEKMETEAEAEEPMLMETGSTEAASVEVNFNEGLLNVVGIPAVLEITDDSNMIPSDDVEMRDESNINPVDEPTKTIAETTTTTVNPAEASAEPLSENTMEPLMEMSLDNSAKTPSKMPTEMPTETFSERSPAAALDFSRPAQPSPQSLTSSLLPLLSSHQCSPVPTMPATASQTWKWAAKVLDLPRTVRGRSLAALPIPNLLAWICQTPNQRSRQTSKQRSQQ